MTHSSYRLRQIAWPVWKWKADYEGETARQGYALTRGLARWAARNWLRSRHRPAGAPQDKRPRPLRFSEQSGG